MLNTPEIFTPTARKWKNYVCAPFELDEVKDIARGTGWTETLPKARVTSDALAGTTIGIKVKTWNSGDPHFYLTDKDENPYDANTTVVSSAFEGVELDKWICLAEGVEIQFDSFSGVENTLDAGDVCLFNIPNTSDRRWKKTYFGGCITYIDLPFEPGQSSVTDKIPYLRSPGQGWTVIYNVHGTRFFGSTVDTTGNLLTDIRLISAPDLDSTIDSHDYNTWYVDIQPFFNARATDLLDAPGYIGDIQATGKPIFSVLDKSFSGEGFLSTDTARPGASDSFDQDGSTNIPQERLWLHFYDDPLNLEADYAANQMVAIMIIPM